LGRPSFFSRADFFLYGAENFSEARHVYTARKKIWKLGARIGSAQIASQTGTPDTSDPDATYAK